jgi:hypothetical protein
MERILSFRHLRLLAGALVRLGQRQRMVDLAAEMPLALAELASAQQVKATQVVLVQVLLRTNLAVAVRVQLAGLVVAVRQALVARVQHLQFQAQALPMQAAVVAVVA